jgi:hypothetical protein
LISNFQGILVVPRSWIAAGALQRLHDSPHLRWVVEHAACRAQPFLPHDRVGFSSEVEIPALAG